MRSGFVAQSTLRQFGAQIFASLCGRCGQRVRCKRYRLQRTEELKAHLNSCVEHLGVEIDTRVRQLGSVLLRPYHRNPGKGNAELI